MINRSQAQKTLNIILLNSIGMAIMETVLNLPNAMPFNTVPRVVGTLNHKIILLLPCNCNSAVVNCNILSCMQPL